MDKAHKLQQELDKCNKELKKTKVDLGKAYENTMEMAKKSTYDIVEDYKKSNKLQEKLNYYGLRGYHMEMDDIRAYLR